MSFLSCLVVCCLLETILIKPLQAIYSDRMRGAMDWRVLKRVDIKNEGIRLNVSVDNIVMKLQKGRTQEEINLMIV